MPLICLHTRGRDKSRPYVEWVCGGMIMFSIFKKDPQDKQLRESLFAFWAEMEKNMELFYVMDQRQFVTGGFLLDVWPRVCDMDIIKRHEPIRIYAQAIEDFNSSFKVFKEYETWYLGDIKNKSPENARKLNGLKEGLDQKVVGMEGVIITAGQELEREMLQLGLLKA